MTQEELDVLLDEFEALALEGHNNNHEFVKGSFAGLSFANRMLIGIDLRRADLRDCDFTGSTLCGAVFALAKLSGASFLEADISNSTFQNAIMEPEQLINAIWNGEVITDAFTTPESRLTNIITNAFSQLGCLQKSNVEWVSLTAENRALLYPSDPEMIEDFWANVESAIQGQIGDA